jgi:CRISPR/Cas system-associated endonuclease Cas1
MPTLYLTEQNSIVRKTSDRLIVEKDHEVLLEIPCLKLDTVLIFGNVQVTTQALVEMLSHGIELAFLSMSGQLQSQLTPPKAKNAEGGVLLRRESMKQYFSAYEKELTTPVSLGEESLTFRQIFRRQAERLARTLTAGETYQPFRLPC